jgi:hypothetical protein
MELLVAVVGDSHAGRNSRSGPAEAGPDLE